MTATRHLYPGTTVYLRARVTADVDLDAQPVALAFDAEGPWIDAAWDGSVGTRRIAQALVDDASFPEAGTHPVYVKVTDGVEIEVFQAAGQVVVH